VAETHKRLTMKPVTLVWSISDAATLPISTDALCHKNFLIEIF